MPILMTLNHLAFFIYAQTLICCCKMMRLFGVFQQAGTTIERQKLLQKRFPHRPIAVLLTLRANCSCFAPKPARSWPKLPRGARKRRCTPEAIKELRCRAGGCARARKVT